jgi:hypothetical protein
MTSRVVERFRNRTIVAQGESNGPFFWSLVFGEDIRILNIFHLGMNLRRHIPCSDRVMTCWVKSIIYAEGFGRSPPKRDPDNAQSHS